MNPYNIPENMRYIFENADHKLSEGNMAVLEEKDARAKKLEKHNGAWYPGLTQSAVFWLRKAYADEVPINKEAYDAVIDRLYQIRQPLHRPMKYQRKGND